MYLPKGRVVLKNYFFKGELLNFRGVTRGRWDSYDSKSPSDSSTNMFSREITWVASFEEMTGSCALACSGQPLIGSMAAKRGHGGKATGG